MLTHAPRPIKPYPTIPEVHLAIFLVDLNLEHVLVRITQHDIVINVQTIFLSKTRRQSHLQICDLKLHVVGIQLLHLS